MKVLVTGAGGQLGHDVVDGLRDRRVTRSSRSGRAELDVTVRSDVAAAVAAARPDVVIHCAAWTAVDACEGDPDRAFAVNADAVRWVREASELVGAHLLTISTDYVFDGTLDRPYHERDTPEPALGVRPRRSSPASARPARTRPWCARRGCAASTGRTWCAPCCAWRPSTTRCRSSTTSAAARRSPPIWRRCCAGSPSSAGRGIHHVTNQGAVSWYEFVRSIVSAMGKDPAMVRPIRTVDLDPPRPAERPANGVLDNAVLREAGPAAAARPPRAARRAGRPADGLSDPSRVGR